MALYKVVKTESSVVVLVKSIAVAIDIINKHTTGIMRFWRIHLLQNINIKINGNIIGVMYIHSTCWDVYCVVSDTTFVDLYRSSFHPMIPPALINTPN